MAAEAGPPTAPIDPIDARRRKGLFFIGMAVACFGFAMAMQLGLNENFVVEQLGVGPAQKGMLEAVRETCGISALVVIAILAGLAEPLVGAAMLVLLAVGISSYFFVYDYLWLVLASLVWSQGLHVWAPLPASMTLALAEPGRSGHRLGQIGAAGSVGFAAGLVAAFLLTLVKVPIRPLYLLAGAVAVVGAGACLGVPRKIKTPGPRLVFRRRYGLYYLLNLLEGWRKQISLCFGGYLLVRVYGTPVQVILLLWCAVQTINFFASPMIGRLIDRTGERPVLVFYFISLIAIFGAYATVTNTHVLYAVFVIDNALFVLLLALNTYAGRIAPKNELTPTLTMGVAMNHVSSVIMPIVGGLLWVRYGYQWLFIVGACVALMSVPVAMCIPRREPATEPQPIEAGGS